MTKTTGRVGLETLILILVGLAPTGAEAVDLPAEFKCPVLTQAGDKKAKDGPALQSTAQNTVWYDHFNLKPACPRPLVLSVGDGEFFRVVIGNTDTTQFNYTITAVPDEKVPTSSSGATGKGLPVMRWTETSLTMRHSKVFARYRVTIALRSDLASASGASSRTKPGAAAAVTARARQDEIKRLTAELAAQQNAILLNDRSLNASTRAAVDRALEQATNAMAAAPFVPAPTSTPCTELSEATAPELLPATFDVWVKTKVGFEIAFTGGTAFSGLRSPHYFIRTDDHGNKTVEEDVSAKDAFKPDMIAVANLRFPDKFKGFGLAFGVGLNSEGDSRYFLGPSYFIGRHFLLHAGLAAGRVDRLPDGQELHQAPINGGDTLSTLPKRFANTFYVGIGFAFVSGAEDAFKGAFGTSQKAEKPAGVAPETTDLSEFTGQYEAADGKSGTAAISGTRHEDWTLDLTLPGEPTTRLKHTQGTIFEVGKLKCDFSKDESGDSLLNCQEGGAPRFTGTKPHAAGR